MTRYFSRFSAVLAILASMAFSTAPALAGGGYAWTDISDKIAERTNRPVWAMAYASPYWYLTDGQDLWSTGHVWRTEGTTMADITTDVRNAGISRVDDIVSDGQSVIFLKNVVGFNNNIEALSYNGSYTNRTATLRNVLRSNENLTSIKGKDGIWMFVTSQNRVFSWNQGSNQVSQITLPFSTPYSNTNSTDNLEGYAIRHSSPPDGSNWFRVTQVLPTSGGWIFVIPTINGTNGHGWSSSDWKVYSYTNGSFTNITSNLSSYLNYFATAYSNGSQVFLVTDLNINDRSAWVIDGTTVKKISNVPGISWNKAIVSNDGSRWVIISNKDYAILEGTTIFLNDPTRDLFLNGAGNGNGTILLGGTVSELGRNEPTYPLTLKLVKLTSGSTANGTTNSSGTFGGGKTYSSYSGPNLTTSGNPSDYEVGNGDTFVYRATASDSNGIDRIEIYANSARVQTCYADTCEYSNVYYTNGLSTRAIPFSAKAYDRNGNLTESSNENLTINQSGSNTGNTTGNGQINGQNGNTYFWTWTEPNNATYIKRGETLTYNVGATDADGLKRIEVYANGYLKRTCDYYSATGNQTCSATLYGNDYSLNSQVALNARITDANNAESWTALQYLTVQDTNYNNSNTTGDISAWGWFDPSGSTLARNGSTTFRVQANATQGLSLIEVYVNGSLKRTCFGQQNIMATRLYGTQSCDMTIYGTDYSNGSALSLNARATDYYGKTAWSDSKTITVQDNGTGQGTSINGSVGLEASPNKTSFNNGEQVTFNGSAQDPDGLQRIEILTNGSVSKTCYYSNSTSWETCAYTTNVYSDGNYTKTFNVSVNAYDRYGYTRGVNPITYSVYGQNGSNSNNGTGDYPAVWSWSDPDKSEVTTAESVVYRVGAWDNDGLNRIEIYVNGILAQNCNFGTSAAYGNRECQYTLNGGNFKDGDQVYVNAKAVDVQSREAWASARTYRIKGGTTSNSNRSSWIWSDPNVSEINGSQNVMFYVGAWAQNGVRKIEILANGSVVKTCDYGYSASGNQQCGVPVATSYAGTTYANYSGRVTDGNYTTFDSETKSYTIKNGTTQTSDIGGTISMSSDRDNGYSASDLIKFTANGQDANGVDRIELMVNARLVKVCYTGSCSWTGGPYADRSSVTYGARLVDLKGNSYFTGYKTIYKK